MNTTPMVIYFHKGNSPYLKYSLRQMREYVGDSRFVLLGDESNDRYSFVEHVRINALDSEVFDEIYKHLSTNSFDLELLCFKRWFIIRDFLEQQQHEGPVLVFDSDTLVYVPVVEIFRAVSSYDIGVCNKLGPEYMYFSGRRELGLLCEFIVSYYSRTDRFAKLEAELEEYRASPGYCGGGICDMRLIRRYILENKRIVFDFATDAVGAGYFDDNINDTQGYQSSRGIKKIIWNGPDPFRVRLDGKLEALKGLHFQGSYAKRFVASHYRGRGLVWMLAVDGVQVFFHELLRTLRGAKTFVSRFLARFTQVLRGRRQ